jgi:hypothetical protein
MSLTGGLANVEFECVWRFECVWGNVGLREICDRIAARFEEQDDLLVVGDLGSAEPHAHPSAHRLDVQQSLDAETRIRRQGSP